MQHANDPRKKQEKGQPVFPDMDGSIGREGGDDSLAETNPTDLRADEKVIVNEQASNQTVNQPSQSEIDNSYQDVVNE